MRGIRFSRLVATVFRMAIGVELCVSANLLTYIGLPYVTDGGALILKFHPGTDLLVVPAALLLLSGPAAFFSLLPASIRAYLLSLLICVLYALIFTGADNVIVLLDTFLPAGLAAVLITGMTPSAMLRLRLNMQCLFGLNAVLALSEALMKCTLIPLYLGDEAYRPKLDDFRPTALYDHPLTGALMTMMGLALAPQSGVNKHGYVTLMWAAMLAFGGRMAIATSLMVVFLTHGMPMITKTLSWGRQARQRLCLAMAGMLLAAPVIALTGWSGLADRLSGHLYWDASAQVRLAQWDILTYLDARQIVFGTPRRELLENLNALRLSSGVGVIENFWLLMFASLGVFGFVIFCIAILSLCLWCWKISQQSGRVLLVSVLIVASASNSLGRKSTVLVCLVASIACVDRPSFPVQTGAGRRGLTRQLQAA